MSNQSSSGNTKSGESKPFVTKPSSPFNNDPYNNRSGKGGNKSNTKIGVQKMKSASVPKFKGGSGGDR